MLSMHMPSDHDSQQRRLRPCALGHGSWGTSGAHIADCGRCGVTQYLTAVMLLLPLVALLPIVLQPLPPIKTKSLLFLRSVAARGGAQPADCLLPSGGVRTPF